MCHECVVRLWPKNNFGAAVAAASRTRVAAAGGRQTKQAQGHAHTKEKGRKNKGAKKARGEAWGGVICWDRRRRRGRKN
jgi:hypothetical protein